MEESERQLAPGEHWVTQVDPGTGRITQTVERNWLLMPFYGLSEIASSVTRGRMTTSDIIFLTVVLLLIGVGR